LTIRMLMPDPQGKPADTGGPDIGRAKGVADRWNVRAGYRKLQVKLQGRCLSGIKSQRQHTGFDVERVEENRGIDGQPLFSYARLGVTGITGGKGN
jgi:hypothetical protein